MRDPRTPLVFDVPLVLRWLDRYADLLDANQSRLTDLDSAIGDADHGLNMARGFAAVRAKHGLSEQKDLGEMLKTVAMTLISTVGGASGPLYGTLFLQAGAALGNRQEASAGDFAAALSRGVAAVASRGKAALGDKTMLDVLQPVAERLTELAGGADFASGDLVELAAFAEAKCRETVPLTARKGRASYLGERSVGHQDPGATSAALLFAALAEACGP